MKNGENNTTKLFLRLSQAAFLLALAGCHSTGPTSVRPTAAIPVQQSLPEWVEAESPDAAEDAPQIQIETKFIERDFVEGAEAPANIESLAGSEGADILSAPKVTLLAGNLAHIQIVQELTYPVENDGKEEFHVEPIGVSCHLRATPHEDPETFEVKVFADLSEFEGWHDPGDGKPKQPIISRRQVDSTMTLRSGETAVIGGLVREEAVEIQDKVPVLGDLPLIGASFHRDETEIRQRELFVTVTPTLVQ